MKDKIKVQRRTKGCGKCMVSEQNIYCGNVNPISNEIILCSECEIFGEEMTAFNTGFNMGWDACKKKVIKEDLN